VSQTRPRPRRRSILPALLVVVLVLGLLAVGLVVADGYAERRAEQESAAELQRQLRTPDLPSVDIGGDYFLPQVVGRSLDTVRVVLDDIPAEGEGSLPVAHADLALTDVTTTNWFVSMTVAHAEGTARIDWSDLPAVGEAPLRYVGDGRVQVEPTTTVIGREVKATITGIPELDAAAQTITLGDPRISVAGVDLPGFTADALLQALLQPIPVTGIPFELRLTSIDPQETGLYAGLAGDDLIITR
jgi:hypothetical protein